MPPPPPPTSTTTLPSASLTTASEENKFVVPAKWDEHPGGQALLQMGRDSPRPDLLFLCYHLGLDVDGKISAIAKKKNINTPSRGKLFEDIHREVIRIKKEKAFHSTVFTLWCYLVLIILPPVFFSFLWHPTPLLGFLSGVLWVTYSFNIFHMRHHKGGNLFGNKFVDGVTSPFFDFLETVWTINPKSWIENHQGSHHLYTNNDSLDHDVWQPFPLLRLHPKQEKKAFHRAQAFYAPLLFCGTTVSFPFDGLFIHKTGIHVFLLYVLLTWVIPYYNAGWEGLASIIVMYCTTGTMMAYLFQVSHNHRGLGERNQELTNFDAWVKMQVEESVSWGGYLACLFFGGINFQVEHHVCPALDPTLYYFLHPELVKICKKHGITYTYEPTVFHAVYEYHRWLSLMASSEQRK